MSGTSADGIDVALVGIESPKSVPLSSRSRPRARQQTSFDLLGHSAFPYPAAVRRTILAAMNSQRASVADLARLNFLLGELYAEAVLKAQTRYGVRAEVVGCHGQTIYHQGTAETFLGRKLAVTWQTGESAVLASRLGVPVVSDFRPADMAAGGQGAPLVPFLDYLLYRDREVGRIALNIGGIANVTAIRAGATPSDVIAFDTGPGNMVIDALTEKLFREPYDRDGKIGARGCVMDDVISDALRAKFFRRQAPKTAGREEFGREFADEFLRACKRSAATGRHRRGRLQSSDVIATATALTARSIAEALRSFVLPLPGNFSELIVSGGGAKNPTLMGMLANRAAGLGLGLRSSDEFGIPPDAKEAIAFAVLAFETWNRRPSNLPAATGARRPAVLGKISYP
jgi:anhydro-N-acetylmuramic acid kinase